MTEQRFNVVDEAWIPVVNAGLVSLKDIFTKGELESLGGTAVEKVAIMKLLCALAQAAKTPENNEEWAQMGSAGLSQAVLAYLERWHDAFWLYGDAPFLQMPAVGKANLMPYGVIMPEVAIGNTTVLTQRHVCPALTDADKALLLLVNMSCCLGGKKVDSSVVLSAGHSKSKSAKSGPALCSFGLLHTFLTGCHLQETVWLNLLTREGIGGYAVFTEGLGTAPWEVMPQGEICPTAEKLKQSLMGRLVPMARFCLLEEAGLRYVEGIQHPDYQVGYADPSASIRANEKKTQMLWCDPSKRPWRSLSAMLSFMRDDDMSSRWHCPLLRLGMIRLKASNVKQFGIWSGGVRVSSNAGEQYLSGSDDMVESEVLLTTEMIDQTDWFPHLQDQMLKLEEIAKILEISVNAYYKEFKDGSADGHAKRAAHHFWQWAEGQFQDLLESCNKDADDRLRIMKTMVYTAHTVFQSVCPQDTARQLQSWAQHRPRLGKFLHDQ